MIQFYCYLISLRSSEKAIIHNTITYGENITYAKVDVDVML